MNEEDGGDQKATQTPFERFQDLTRKLVSVPKKELDEKLAEEKALKAKAKAAKG